MLMQKCQFFIDILCEFSLQSAPNLGDDVFKISQNTAWILVIFGGILECFWVSGLKYAQSVALYIFTALAICVSFICAILAMKKIEVSVCYCVFVGIGTAGVVISEMIFFHENFSLIKIIFIALLLTGVIGLKFVSGKKS